MSNVRDRRRSLLAVALGLMVTACLAVLAFMLYQAVVFPILNTEYAPGYSGEAFKAVAVGDSEERVLDLLGEPLERYSNATYPSHVYLRYSKAIGASDSHLTRAILLQDSRVVRIWHSIFMD